MPPTYILARDHLQRAATILRGQDAQSLQLRHIIERTIQLMDESVQPPPVRQGNVLDLHELRHEYRKR